MAQSRALSVQQGRPGSESGAALFCWWPRMKFPVQVTLGGKEWTIRKSKRKLRDCLGKCDPSTKTITICRSLEPGEREWSITLIHESWHAILWMIDDEAVERAAIEQVEMLEVCEVI